MLAQAHPAGEPLDFVDRPIAAGLAIAIVLLIGFHIWGVLRERRIKQPETNNDHNIHDSQQG